MINIILKLLIVLILSIFLVSNHMVTYHSLCATCKHFCDTSFILMNAL